jgi:hypothetical protein
MISFTMRRKPEITHLRRNFVQNPRFSFLPEDQVSHRKALLRKSIPTTQQSDYPPTKMSIEVTVVGVNETLHSDSWLYLGYTMNCMVCRC